MNPYKAVYFMSGKKSWVLAILMQLSCNFHFSSFFYSSSYLEKTALLPGNISEENNIVLVGSLTYHFPIPFLHGFGLSNVFRNKRQPL